MDLTTAERAGLDEIDRRFGRANECRVRWVSAEHRLGYLRRAFEHRRPGFKPTRDEDIKATANRAKLLRRDFIFACASLTEVAPELSVILQVQTSKLAEAAEGLGTLEADRERDSLTGYVPAAHSCVDAFDESEAAA